MSDKAKLSLRVRPDAEVSRWVYDAIVALVAKCDEARAEAWERTEKVLQERDAHFQKRLEEARLVFNLNERIGELQLACAEAEKERDEAIRLGDERLATLWDEKQAEVKKLTDEIAELKKGYAYDVRVFADLVRELDETKALLKVKIETVEGLHEEINRVKGKRVPCE